MTARNPLAVRARDVREGSHIVFALLDRQKRPMPQQSGEVWSRGPMANSWWVKPDDDPDHPVVVRTPDWFEPYGRAGAGRVVLSRQAEFAKSGSGAEHLADRRIEQKGDVKISIAAPDEPGRYALYIVVGPTAEHDPVETITVAP